MGRAQVLFNQKHGRGRGRGSGPGRSSAEEAKRRTNNRPKWNAGKDHDEIGNQQGDDPSERLDHEISILEANVSSQRYVTPLKNDDSSDATLNMLQSNPETSKQQMNYALKHVSLADLYRIPARLVSTIIDAEPVNVQQNQDRQALKSGRSSLLGLVISPVIDTANQLSKLSILPSLQESNNEMNTPSKSVDVIEANGSAQEEERVSIGDLTMRLRLHSQEQFQLSSLPTTVTDNEDMDEGLKVALNCDETPDTKEVEANEKEKETLDENLEDWLDSII